MQESPVSGEHSSLLGPPAPPFPLTRLETPALLLDRARLERNLEGMAALSRRSGVRLRPHAKSHKSPDLARLQEVHGARGFCTATLSELRVFAEAGFEDLLLAYPSAGSRARSLVELAATAPGRRIETAVDSRQGVLALGREAAARGLTLGVWIKVNTGLDRAGVLPGEPALLELVEQVARTSGLVPAGLLTHAGQAYRARPSEIPAIGRREAELMVEAATRIERAGFGRLRVGLGSNPTVPFAAGVDGVDEIHPGVYVFGDRQQVALGAMRSDDAALTVLTAVVSRPVRDRWVVDAGSKALSSDRGAHGTEMLRGYGAVRRIEDHRLPDPGGPLPFDPATLPPREDSWFGIEAPVLSRLSEEHGVLEEAAGLEANPGDLLEIVPNHACPVVHLAPVLYLTEGEGAARRVTAAWPVTAKRRW